MKFFCNQASSSLRLVSHLLEIPPKVLSAGHVDEHPKPMLHPLFINMSKGDNFRNRIQQISEKQGDLMMINLSETESLFIIQFDR